MTPLLVIHGLGLSRRSWAPVLPILGRENEVLALDLPGFGTAPPLRDRTPTVAALTDAIEAVLDRDGLDRVDVAGNSLGGWIALELARRGRATSAVAFSPSGLEAPAERMFVVGMNELLRARSLAGAPVAALLAANPVSRSAMLGGLHARPWRLPADDAAAEIRDFAGAPSFHPTLYSTTGSKAPTGLSEIRVPVRICFGTSPPASRPSSRGARSAPAGSPPSTSSSHCGTPPEPGPCHRRRQAHRPIEVAASLPPGPHPGHDGRAGRRPT